MHRPIRQTDPRRASQIGQTDSQSARPIAIFQLLQLWSCVMGIAWTPPIVPKGEDENVYLVVDDLGSYGEVWREIETVRTDRAALITDLISGQYSRPVRVVSFNITEGWSRDASADIAREVRRRCDLQRAVMSEGLQDFVVRFEGPDRHQLTLRLV